jgi:6-phosphogluconolactonase
VIAAVNPDNRHLRLHQYADSSALTTDLCRRIDALSRQSIAGKGRFVVVLAGGTTPRQLYQRLRGLDSAWDRWHIYFGDERFLPRGHADRNDTMADAAWLTHVPIPPHQVHRLPAAASVESAANDYDKTLERAPGFDLVLLGLGEDGHTASLFPNDGTGIHSSRLAVAIYNAPKPPPRRVSLTAHCLGLGANVWFIVSGAGKKTALQTWLAGAALPPAAITPATGVDIFTDITF